jgi:hypothetical protein
MNQKGFANIILVVVIIILAGAVGYFALIKKSEPMAQQSPTPTSTQTKTPVSPTPAPKDKTANWKTYTNAQYGFEFKYPANYVVTKTPGENNKFVTFSVDHFQVIVYPGDLSLDAFIKDQAQNYLISNYQKINFAGQSAYEGIDQGMTNAYVIYLKNKEYIYRLILNTNGKDTLPELKAGLTTEQKQILSTFKIY